LKTKGQIRSASATFAAVLGLVLGSQSARATSSHCDFRYDAALKTTVVLPLLSERFGAAAEYIDSDHPAILRKSERVELIYVATKSVLGLRARYEKAFVIVVDACTRKVIEQYDGDW